MIKKIIYALWALLALAVLICILMFRLIAAGHIGYMPPIAELENPSYKFATQVFSEDGELLGTWSMSKENRVYAGYDELPTNIIQALIATEDRRFAEHSGIDGRGLARAIIKRGILMQSNAGGGSTITQQLAKLLYTENPAENTFQRLLQKPIEWVIAVKLERYYTKEEILTMYLNKFDFINNAVGIKTAARTYFDKAPKELSVEESATLVGMCKNPALYNPRRFNERSRERRNVVLAQMCKAGYLTEQAKDSLQALPLKLNFRPVDHKEGLATYFREYLRTLMTAKKPDPKKYRGWQTQKFYEDSLAWETNPLYGWCAKNNKNIYTDGLKIYTTINAKMQRYAEEAVTEHLGGFLQEQFFKEKRRSKTAPFSKNLTTEQVNEILNRSVRQSERYNVMLSAGASAEEIRKAFDTPQEMSVFTWQGSKDTIMTPMDSIRYYKHFLRTGFMSMNPMNGYVKAYVGGANYPYFQYDMAMTGRRQVGSTIKPFLYTLAMENGFSPCDRVRKVEQTLITETGEPWTPRNTNKDRDGELVTLKWGLTHSDNYISAYLMGKLNPYSLVRLIHNFGVLNQNIPPVVSLCLGPCEISVGEMVSAYTAFVNRGIRVAPLFVTHIEDN
ncbi:MAG: transglycosylase domain-containing protein, partial [Prevotellaceae bacterium]|nr:transglycosylase domain-containing protein [Prevotellaceae bacterium]